MKNSLKTFILLIFISFIFVGCGTKNDNKIIETEEDSYEEEKDTGNEKDKPQHRVYNYKAVYKLDAGKYIFKSEHTHKSNVFITFFKESVEDTDNKAKSVMEQESIVYKKKESVAVEEGKLYRFKLSHYDGKIYINIKEGGNWIIYADVAPGEVVPYSICNDKEEEINPITFKVIDNKENEIYKGYFKDEDVKDRSLSEWKGEWQSIFKYLQSGALDSVMEAKAKTGKMSKEEYKEYYRKGYMTDVDKIIITNDNHMSFTKGNVTNTAEYKYVGYKILQYKKGNRGVRFMFTKINGDAGAPMNVQFSDHNIYPTNPSHYHLFFGDKSHEELWEEMDNWPTYYPENMTEDEIVHDMLAH